MAVFIKFAGDSKNSPIKMDIRGREKERKNIYFPHDIKGFTPFAPKLARRLLIIGGKGWPDRKTGAESAAPGGIAEPCAEI